ncbi:hypothetical protein RchiOBHm_Chr3g0465781 [Rosa chinensis]|uniref:Uncharacterized protein n=1 Tax=Rosa chinensis TaxID=74649 RepID=A0A2P6R9T0_ROSCH|nr:hypothetical protein RchiOBHm_Chr3g0465781 [Rosa chinensis]
MIRRKPEAVLKVGSSRRLFPSAFQEAFSRTFILDLRDDNHEFLCPELNNICFRAV